jgi:non-heme chloroperoxidase
VKTFAADDGAKLAYADEGQGPPLVLVHGWTMTSQVWRRQFEGLAGRCRIIAPDLRGCGASEARAGTYNMARYAADLDQLLTHLRLPRATLVGWSMGGGIAMEYLSRFGSDALNGVGLVDFPPRLEEDPAVADKVCASLQTKRDTFIPNFMRRMILDLERNDLVAFLVAESQRCKAETACEMYRAMRPTGPSRSGPESIPAFLAFPTNGWFRPALESWRRRFPQHTAPDFPRSKHCPFLEEPDAFNDALLAFVQAHAGPPA